MTLHEPVPPEAMEPIFVMGRQHSGNTMLATVLGNVPSVLGLTGEGGFFEDVPGFDALPPTERAERVARRIRDDGARDLLRKPEIPFDASVWQEITPALKDAALRGAGAVELYGLGMQRVLELLGSARWVQKATSYIFLVDEVLEAFPRARLIFLVRNPYDLAASTARRNGSSRHTARLVIGWNRGVARALRLQAARPERLMVLRYEDLVQDSEASIRRVCAFCALPFDAAYLDVPHVNKSETPYNRKSERRGLNASRVYYYKDVLSPTEQEAVSLAINTEVLGHLYPELDTQAAHKAAFRERCRAVLLFASSLGVLLKDEGQRLFASPLKTVARLSRRFGRVGSE